MNRLSIFVERIFPLIKNILIPALLFAGGIFTFYAYGHITPSSLIIIHGTFFVTCFASFLTLLYFNQNKPVFYILTITLGYILINYLKNAYGDTYNTTSYYLTLCFLLPLNFALFYYLPNQRLLSKTNVYILLGLFAQFSLGEFLGRNQIMINLPFADGYIGNLSLLGFGLFSIALLSFFITLAEKGRIMDCALFFAALNIMFGLIYSDNATAITLFFSLAAITLLISIIRDIHHNIYKDNLTGLSSRYAFMINSEHFPLKYSIGLIAIDDYEHLATVFGRRDRNNLIRMIATRIQEEENEDNLYRYNDGELLILYKNENKNESFEHLEKIRRSVASADFMLGNLKKAIKLTVSTCASEKKRSDANSMEVLFRARKVLQKANEFSHNISHKA